MSKVLLVIPARYASTRFPGKPLALIGGQPMILHVWRQCQALASEQVHVLIATDDERIAQVGREAGAQVCLTAETHQSGTERCAEALSLWQAKTQVTYDYLINVQGDEPFVQAEQLEKLLAYLTLPSALPIATLAKRLEEPSKFYSPDVVKVNFDAKTRMARSFSRQVPADSPQDADAAYLQAHPHYKHIGLYAFKAEVLPELVALAPSEGELREKLEQLRWFEAGYPIAVLVTELETLGIDRPEHLQEAENYWQSLQKG